MTDPYKDSQPEGDCLESGDLESGDLEAFERQLRSLTPREAGFQLEESIEVSVEAAPVARRRAKWAATLLATWSLGAAAGIGGTLVCMRFITGLDGSESVAARPVDNVSNENVPNDARAVAQDASASEIAGGRESATGSSNVNLSANPLLAGESQNTEKNSGYTSPWSFLSQSVGQTVSTQGPLTSRSIAAALVFETPVFEGQFLDGQAFERDSETSRGVDREGMSPNRARGMGTSSEKVELPAPINQRDLLRDLLQI